MAAVINCHLHEDLTTEILVRLPVKSLLRFKSVCKEWNAIITSLSFIRKHSHHAANHTRLLLYLYGSSSGSCSGRDDTFALFPDETLERRFDEDCVNLPAAIDAIVSPCMNGVFCVLNMHNKLALWNPATRRLALLPDPPETPYEIAEIGYGIIGTSSKDFKIVLLYYGESELFVNSFALYRSSNDTWRYFKHETLLDNDAFVSSSNCGATFVNGFYYWIKTSVPDYNSVILAFDMLNEVFQQIEMPELDYSSNQELYLYKDSLALFSDDKIKRVKDNYIGIWLMKKHGCWTKLYSVILPFCFLWSLGFWKDNKIFLLTHPDHDEPVRELVMYDLNSHETRTIGVGNVKKDNYSMWSLPFKESIVSVKYKPGI